MTDEPTAQGGTPETTPEAASIKREMRILVKLVVAFLAVLLLVRTFVVQGYPVQGDSMEPTLAEGDRILVYKLPVVLRNFPLLKAARPIDSGDLVVFDSATEAGRRYVKRVIAAGPARAGAHVVRAATEEPQVTVRYLDGEVYVNNQRVREDYLMAEEHRTPGLDHVALKAGEFYVLGDHRSVSKDSRTFGPVEMDEVVGRAVLRFWPLRKFGWL